MSDAAMMNVNSPDAPYHDTGYKYLFSHAELVQQLLEGFAPPELVRCLDFSTLTIANGSYITPAMKQREDDVVWSVKMGSGTLYLYLLLEFQSTVDAAMPVRMLQYVAALYEALIKDKHLDLHQGLPAVFPIVLYNGDARWRVAGNIREMIHCPAILNPYQPNMSYFLLDEGAYSQQQLSDTRNAVAAVFSMENATDYASASAAIRHMAQAVQQMPDKHRMDRVLSRWIKRHLQRNLPQVMIPGSEGLLEDTSMLATNMQKWYTQAHDSGRQEGRREGRQEGRQEGKLEGLRVVLQQMLELKFPGCDVSGYQKLIAGASEADLVRYNLRVAVTNNLGEVFGTNK